MYAGHIMATADEISVRAAATSWFRRRSSFVLIVTFVSVLYSAHGSYRLRIDGPTSPLFVVLISDHGVVLAN